MQNSTSNKKNSTSNSQVRFNWGYHDGANEAGRKRENRSLKPHFHFDKMYIKGYERGYYDFLNGDYNGCSKVAWKNRNK